MIAVPSPRLAVGAVLAQTALLAALFAFCFTFLSDGDPFDATPSDFGVLAVIHGVNALVVVGVVILWLGGRSLAEVGWARDPRLARSVGLGLAGALGCVSIVALWGLVFGGVPGLRETLAAFASIPPEQRLLFAGVGLGAAFIEESVFRGTLQPMLVARLGRPAGVVVGAVIFSAYHLRFGLVGFLTKSLFGVIFGGLRESTGRLWAPAIAHFGVWFLVGLS